MNGGGTAAGSFGGGRARRRRRASAGIGAFDLGGRHATLGGSSDLGLGGKSANVLASGLTISRGRREGDVELAGLAGAVPRRRVKGAVLELAAGSSHWTSVKGTSQNKPFRNKVHTEIKSKNSPPVVGEGEEDNGVLVEASGREQFGGAAEAVGSVDTVLGPGHVVCKELVVVSHGPQVVDFAANGQVGGGRAVGWRSNGIGLRVDDAKTIAVALAPLEVEVCFGRNTNVVRLTGYAARMIIGEWEQRKGVCLVRTVRGGVQQQDWWET